MNRFHVEVFLKAFPELMRALPTTLSVGLLAMTIGLVLGSVVGILRYFKIPVLEPLLKGYVSFFRGTPLMIQLFIFFFGLPQVLPVAGTLNAFQASVLIMGINAGAYTAETIRAAIFSVDKIQHDAGLSIGFTGIQTMWYIQLPQAIRVAIPSLGNTFIGVIQGTALTFMLGLNDLMGLAKMRAATNYRFFEMYLAAGIIYWLVTLVLSQINQRFERHFSKGRAS